MISEYKIIVTTTPSNLSTLVTSWLQQGWNLYGNPFCQPIGLESVICQAVVKHNEEIPST